MLNQTYTSDTGWPIPAGQAGLTQQSTHAYGAPPATQRAAGLCAVCCAHPAPPNHACTQQKPPTSHPSR